VNPRRVSLTTIMLSLLGIGVMAQEKVVRLYESPAPASEQWTQKEKESRTNAWQTRVVFNVANPTLTVFQPDPAKAVGTAVVICPGGGFHPLSHALHLDDLA
jgi:hypothetical protein